MYTVKNFVKFERKETMLHVICHKARYSKKSFTKLFFKNELLKKKGIKLSLKYCTFITKILFAYFGKYVTLQIHHFLRTKHVYINLYLNFILKYSVYFIKLSILKLFN